MEILFIQLSDFEKCILMTGFVVQGHICELEQMILDTLSSVSI